MENRQYFSDNRDLPSDRKPHRFCFHDHEWSFLTDHGVFSMDGVDSGTELLLEHACREDIHGKILDMGCGYGVIGIVLQTLYPSCTTVCADVNPRALELTEENSRIMNAPVKTVYSDGFASIQDGYDVILTNPPIRAGKQVVYGIFEGAYAHLNQNGLFLTVVRKQQGAASAVKKLQEVFGSCEILDKKKGFWILKCVK